MEPYIGQIMLFGFDYAPVDWAICDGSLLPIAEYDSLFSLIGTTYGGDGVTTFGLPDLRGRVPIHMGQGPGLSNRTLGEMGGTEQVALLASQMPPHSHPVLASAGQSAPTGTPGQGVTFGVAANASIYSSQGGTTQAVLAPSMGQAGGNQPHDNMMPTLVANYCIALYGIYPQFD